MDSSPNFQLLKYAGVASLFHWFPFLWSPFYSLFSLGTSWGYSPWLICIVPLLIANFVPQSTRATISGPFRFAYLQHGSYLTSLFVTWFRTFTTTLESAPHLAIPVFFFLPALPMLFAIILPALPVAWYYVSHLYRVRLKAITTSASETTARLEVALNRARRAAALAHTYEEKALDITSTTRRTASHTLLLHSTKFFDTAVSAWAAVGHTTEHAKRVAAASREVVPAAGNIRQSELYGHENRTQRLAEILYKQATDANVAASNAEQLAVQARESVVWSENAKNQAEQARQKMGVKLANAVANVERQAEKVRAALGRAVEVAVEGDMDAAEASMTQAGSSFERSVQKNVDDLCSSASEARRAWVELSAEV
ncbi:hypothetical protein BJV77DRAFT_1012190 [Russula vinacea]|nr:hypothetical protein BJV77DRAFT_1012190 [Russula vinacea]